MSNKIMLKDFINICDNDTWIEVVDANNRKIYSDLVEDLKGKAVGNKEVLKVIKISYNFIKVLVSIQRSY